MRTRRALLARALSVAALPVGIWGKAGISASRENLFGVLGSGSFLYRDPRLLPVPPRRDWRLTSSLRGASTLDLGPARDPKHQIRYAHRVQVFCLTETEEVTMLDGRKFVLHFQEPEDEPLALRAGAALARIYWIGRDYLDRGPRGNRPIHVWLDREGEAGGEEHESNIYLFAIREPRPPAEWLRELAHEYSHIFIPPAGRFLAPEPWANGYLGERLFLKWLLADNGLEDAWGEPVDAAAYVRYQVTPLREQFLSKGPAAPESQRNDAEGMAFFIGQMLALEAMHGPKFLRAVFDHFRTPRPQNLGGYLTSVIRELKPPVLYLDPTVHVATRGEPVEESPGAFRRASYWTFLPGGRWRIGLDGDVPPESRCALEAADLRSAGGAAWEVSFPTPNGAWRRLDITAPPGRHFRLDRIVLERR
jgi:hypothetical protein